MGPKRAAQLFVTRPPVAAAVRIEAHLYGSLSATGQGHLTDRAILEVLGGRGEILWHEENLPKHPNGIRFLAFDAGGSQVAEWEVYSIGGGELLDHAGLVDGQAEEIYSEAGIGEILQICRKTRSTFASFVRAQEKEEL